MAQHETSDRRSAVDAKLTELMLYAKELCPGAVVDTSPLQYEDEDGHVEVYPPASLSDAEVDRIELTLASRPGKSLSRQDCTLFVPCLIPPLDKGSVQI